MVSRFLKSATVRDNLRRWTMKSSMVRLHPSVLERHGKKSFVVLPYEEFVRVKEELEDFDDLKALRAAKRAERGAATITTAQARKALRLSPHPPSRKRPTRRS